MAEVEQAMLTGNWNRKTQREIAERHGVVKQTVRTYFTVVKRAWQNASQLEDIETERAKWRVKIEIAQQAALQAGDLKALSSLLSVESRVLGLEKLQIDVKTTSDVTVRAEPPVVESRRLRTARETGDPQRVLEALREDAREQLVVLEALDGLAIPAAAPVPPQRRIIDIEAEDVA